jgi:hypothetical protein
MEFVQNDRLVMDQGGYLQRSQRKERESKQQEAVE